MRQSQQNYKLQITNEPQCIFSQIRVGTQATFSRRLHFQIFLSTGIYLIKKIELLQGGKRILSLPDPKIFQQNRVPGKKKDGRYCIIHPFPLKCF